MSALGLIQRLDRQRFQPLVLLQKGDGALASFFRKGGIPTELAPPTPHLAHGERLRLGELLLLGRAAWRLSRALRRRGIDIVHTNDGRTHATWALPSRLAGARLVWHHRGSADALGLRHLAPLLANQVIAVSDYAISRECSRYPPARRSVIHSPFDVTINHDNHAARNAIVEEIGCQSNAHLVAFCGAFISRKRPLLFVEVIAAMRRARPGLPVEGVMFGEAVEITSEAVMAHAAALGISGAIHIMGFRSPGAYWLAGCDALLVPAVEEPFGRTLIEAMLVGTPVVATRSGGNIEALLGGAVGMLVAPEDSQVMANALIDLFDHPAFAKDLAQHARQDAQRRFGDKRHAEQIMAIYDRLLAARGRGTAPQPVDPVSRNA